ncbi:Histone-lysine N-methyltransferase [Nymphaea thermarum]|nr:Histone-lysine N-methyltransferase [Nymphaea thermarum]
MCSCWVRSVKSLKQFPPCREMQLRGRIGPKLQCYMGYPVTIEEGSSETMGLPGSALCWLRRGTFGLARGRNDEAFTMNSVRDLRVNGVLQFQKHKYATFEWVRCGKKGYGPQLREDVSKGQFLIEYVGEKTVKGKGWVQGERVEVIDACSKGNLGRFINHSCDSNCRTEKILHGNGAKG